MIRFEIVETDALVASQADQSEARKSLSEAGAHRHRRLMQAGRLTDAEIKSGALRDRTTSRLLLMEAYTIRRA